MNNLILFVISLLMNTTLTVTSPSFKHNELIPAKYTCSGQEINPELNVSGIPQTAKSLTLIMDDPDAPNGGFDHWIMYNIPVQTTITENSAPGKQAKNGKKENKYAGPCPPTGTHHYHFKFYALDKELDLKDDVTKRDLEKAMEGHILAKGELVGLYRK